MRLKKSQPETYLDMIAQAVDVPLGALEVYFEEVKSFMTKSQQGQFRIRIALPIKGHRPGDNIAGFTLVTMPGCCGAVVSTGAFVEPKFRGKGIGNLLNHMRLHIAHDWGYALVLCTDVESNLPQQAILKKNSWEKHKVFVNSRTGNKVCLHSIASKRGRYALGFVLP